MGALGRVRISALAGAALVAIGGIGYVPAALAQVGPEQRNFRIPAGSLSEVAVRFSEQAGVQLVLGSDVAEGLQATAVEGRYSVSQALDRMLAGTGLRWRYASAGVVAIERPGKPVAEGAGAGTKVFGTVRVEGAQNLDAAGFGRLGAFGAGAGANGSSDSAATEGTGSYTTNGSVIASRTPQALQQTTQSVTVMTQQRMEEQNLTDLNQVMDFTPGIDVNTNTAHDQSFFSRGFEIQTYSIDGGAPLSFSPGIEGSIDLAEYDRIEVLRGSAALYGSVGEPGGVISLVRKRPLDHRQFSLELQGGTWSYYRVAADATGPLAFDGHLRGRVIAQSLDRDFFFDRAHEDRPKLYGSLELDLWKNALVRGGASYQNQYISSPNYSGVPRYSNGEGLRIPRSTNYSAPFTYQDVDTIEYFGSFEQKIGSKWLLKLDATSNENRTDAVTQNFAGPRTDLGGIAPGQTTVGELRGTNGGGHFTFSNLGLSADLSGSFTLFGREQQVSIGTQRSRTRLTSFSPTYYDSLLELFLGVTGQTFQASVFNFDPSAVPLPPDVPLYTTFSDGKSTLQSYYATVNLEPFRGLHLNGGARQTYLKSNSRQDQTVYFLDPTSPLVFDGEPTGNKTSNLSPSVSVSYDVTPWFAAYASYNDIFSPQNTLRFAPTDLSTEQTQLATSTFLPPARGKTYEGGVRLKLRDGKLNGHLAYYDTQVRNLARQLNDPAQAISIPNCCYVVTGKNLSRGIDAELNGEIFEGFQLAASYNYNNNKTQGFGPRSPGVGNALRTLFPKHIAKLHASYDVLRGPLSGLTLAAGLRLESKRSILDFRCTVYGVGNACTAQELYAFSQPGYQVVDGLVNYRVTDNIEMSVNFYNIFDKRYFAQPAGVQGSNFYGQPRSFIASLRILLDDRNK